MPFNDSRAARENCGMTRAQFAHLLGVSVRSVHRWENDDALLIEGHVGSAVRAAARLPARVGRGADLERAMEQRERLYAHYLLLKEITGEHS